MNQLFSIDQVNEDGNVQLTVDGRLVIINVTPPVAQAYLAGTTTLAQLLVIVSDKLKEL